MQRDKVVFLPFLGVTDAFGPGNFIICQSHPSVTFDKAYRSGTTQGARSSQIYKIDNIAADVREHERRGVVNDGQHL
jgi:hypothetical protein